MLKRAFQFRRILLISVVIGIFSGLFAVAFIKAIHFFTHLFLGHIPGYFPPGIFGEEEFAGPYNFSIDRPYLIPLTVALGGLISGALIYLFSPESAGVGTDAAIRAFHKRLPIGLKTAVSKLVTSAVTIGSGGVSGKEGPIALIGASIGVTISNLFKLNEKEKNIALATGLGSGISAVFKAPLAGAIISSEVFYKEDFEVEALLPSFVASVVSYIVSGIFLGFQPLFYTDIPPFRGLSIRTLSGYILLGVVSAFVAYILIITFFEVGNYFKRLNIHPILKPALGGFIAGTIGMINPLALGNAYGWIQMLLNRDFSYLTPNMVITGIFLVMLALSFTLGSGGSGGVFGPSLVIGGLTGASVYFVLSSAMGKDFFDLPSMTIVGMISTFAATAKAPLSTIVLVAEMTGGYELLVPSIISVSIAHALSGERSIFPSQVKRRIDSPAHMDEYKAFILQNVKVKDVMTSPVITISPDDTVSKAQKIMEKSFISGIPVVLDETVVGLITSSDVLKVDRDKRKVVKVSEVMTKNPECVTPDTTLFDTLDKFISRGFGRAPVVKDFSSMKLVGIITRADIGRFLASRG